MISGKRKKQRKRKVGSGQTFMPSLNPQTSMMVGVYPAVSIVKPRVGFLVRAKRAVPLPAIPYTRPVKIGVIVIDLTAMLLFDPPGLLISVPYLT